VRLDASLTPFPVPHHPHCVTRYHLFLFLPTLTFASCEEAKGFWGIRVILTFHPSPLPHVTFILQDARFRRGTVPQLPFCPHQTQPWLWQSTFLMPEHQHLPQRTQGVRGTAGSKAPLSPQRCLHPSHSRFAGTSQKGRVPKNRAWLAITVP